MTFYEKVAALCENRGIAITRLATDLGFSSSTPNNWKNMKGKARPNTVKAIADYFSISTDYFSDKADPVLVQSILDNHGIIGNTHAPITIVNSDTPLTEQEIELLNLFRKLSVLKQSQLIVKAAEMLEN